MGRLIEESKVLEILQTSWLNGTVAHRIIDEIKQRIKLEAPTVEAIPKADYKTRLKAEKVTLIDKIRTEIEQEKVGYPPSAGYYKAIMKVLQIIDKYKAETE